MNLAIVPPYPDSLRKLMSYHANVVEARWLKYSEYHTSYEKSQPFIYDYGQGNPGPEWSGPMLIDWEARWASPGQLDKCRNAVMKAHPRCGPGFYDDHAPHCYPPEHFKLYTDHAAEVDWHGSPSATVWGQAETYQPAFRKCRYVFPVAYELSNSSPVLEQLDYKLRTAMYCRGDGADIYVVMSPWLFGEKVGAERHLEPVVLELVRQRVRYMVSYYGRNNIYFAGVLLWHAITHWDAPRPYEGEREQQLLDWCEVVLEELA